MSQSKDQSDKSHDPDAPTDDMTRFQRLTAGAVGAAAFTAGWAADRTQDAFRDAVGRILYGETTSPAEQNTFAPDYGPAPYDSHEPDPKAQETHAQEAVERETREQDRDKGMDR